MGHVAEKLSDAMMTAEAIPVVEKNAEPIRVVKLRIKNGKKERAYLYSFF